MASIVASEGTSNGDRLSDTAYRELRRMIVDGELGQGERLTARLAVENATDEELEQLARVHAEAVRVAGSRRGQRSTLAQVLELTRRFHALLDASAHNPVLVKMIATATAFDFVTRLDMFNRFGRDYPARWAEDHAEIVNALRARDADRAELLMRTHILNTGHYLAAAADDEQ
jgi:DNA-binding GntR family transcriptional regulator